MIRKRQIVTVLWLLALCGSVWGSEPNQGLVAHWKFDEGGGTTALDWSGHGNHGTLVNGPTWTTGKIDGALSFDGVDDYVNCGSSFASVTGSTTKTIMAWAKSDVSDKSGRIITLYRRSDSYSAFVIYPRENPEGNPATWKGLYAIAGNGHKLIDSRVPVTADEWTHIALVQDGAVVHIYVDGVLENSASDAAAPVISHPPNAVIGAYMWYGHGPYPSFLGTIDDVRIYNRALSAEEIEELYQEGGDLVAHWKFDEGSGTTAYDSAGNNDGMLVNGPMWTTGQVGGALSFDGVDDYVDCGSSFASVTGSTTKTIMAWAKSDTTDYPDETGRVLTLYRIPGNSCFSIEATSNPATWQFIYRRSPDNVGWLDSGIAVIAKQWMHIALVQNGANISCYINGVLGNSASDGVVPVISNPPNADIGCFWNGYSNFFDGTIDDVRIYDRALSAEEIEEIYLEGLSVYERAIINLDNAIDEKQEALTRIDVAIEKERAAYDALKELLKSGDYGDLNKHDILRAMQKIHFAIRYEKWSRNVLERSIEKLEDSLSELGYEADPNEANGCRVGRRPWMPWKKH